MAALQRQLEVLAEENRLLARDLAVIIEENRVRRRRDRRRIAEEQLLWDRGVRRTGLQSTRRPSVLHICEDCDEGFFRNEVTSTAPERCPTCQGSFEEDWNQLETVLGSLAAPTTA